MLLKDLTTEDLFAHGADLGMTPRLARRVQTMMVKYRRAQLPERMDQLALHKWAPLRDALRLPHLQVIERVTSPYDGFTKYLFRGETPDVFEAVRIPLMHRPGDEKYIVCVSTQVGCGVGCAFCATGRMGYKRNLATWEIVDQVLKIQDDSEYPVRGVVFMGMGEPLLNYENVIRAGQIFSDPSACAINGKAITISTSGVVPVMKRFTREQHSFRLITSLHAATDELRDKIVPLNRNYPLQQIMDVLREYHAVSRRRVILAWTMIAGVNMNREQMRALRAITHELPFVLDLIPVNDATGQFRAPSQEEIREFIGIFREEVNAPLAIRYSGGKDVHAACGMLAGQTAH